MLELFPILVRSTKRGRVQRARAPKFSKHLLGGRVAHPGIGSGMVTFVQGAASSVLPFILGVFLLWTLASPHFNTSDPGWLSLGPPGPSLLSSAIAEAMRNRDESIKWIARSVPKKPVIERPLLDQIPLTYSTTGKGKVVCLMGMTSNVIDLFSKVERFHHKAFYNRLDYANHQGTDTSFLDINCQATSSCRLISMSTHRKTNSTLCGPNFQR